MTLPSPGHLIRAVTWKGFCAHGLQDPNARGMQDVLPADDPLTQDEVQCSHPSVERKDRRASWLSLLLSMHSVALQNKLRHQATLSRLTDNTSQFVPDHSPPRGAKLSEETLSINPCRMRDQAQDSPSVRTGRNGTLRKPPGSVCQQAELAPFNLTGKQDEGRLTPGGCCSERGGAAGFKRTFTVRLKPGCLRDARSSRLC